MGNRAVVQLVENRHVQELKERAKASGDGRKVSTPPSEVDFAVGDTVAVQVVITEADKTRLQRYEGVVIGKRNRGLNSSFTVRKISHGFGVERTFQLHSPLIDSISVNRRGDVRKAKIYYLRERSGRSARIKEKI